jgi:uncharacterized membrane protein YphA (DoxX/SURF4 family)
MFPRRFPIHGTTLYILLRIVLGSIFVFSGLVKLLDIPAFADLIEQYNLVPHGWIEAVALGLPLAELLAGLGLIFDIKGSLGAIAAMLLLFCFVLWFGILQDLSIDCGCFSISERNAQQDLRQAFYRDIALLGAVGFLYFWRLRQNLRPRSLLPASRS